MSSYLITGSNRGIGLAMVENLSARPASEVSAVFATSRSSDPGAALSAVIKSSGGRVHHVVLEVTSDESGKQAASEVAKIQGNKGLDVLIHNAGVQEPHGLVAGGKPENLPAQELQRVFDVNVMAPHKLTQAFLPLLRQGKDKKIAFISSTVGSMAYSQQKRYDAIPCPSYKITKASVNALMLQWSFGLRDEGFTVKSLSPGWLKTDLGGKDHAPVEVADGAAASLDIIINEGPETTGRFRNIFLKDVVEPYSNIPYDGSDGLF